MEKHTSMEINENQSNKRSKRFFFFLELVIAREPAIITCVLADSDKGRGKAL
jgi:hypothetical protein